MRFKIMSPINESDKPQSYPPNATAVDRLLWYASNEEIERGYALSAVIDSLEQNYLWDITIE
tara:strand:- start:153 stop:338 length:186 start_codon:yes stop_codon:yes gene_type:complete